MGVKVSLHRRARADLKSIRDYITLHASAHSAERVRAHLMQRIRQLSNAPHMGVVSQNPAVRVLQPTRYPYRIYYAVQRDDIVILHIRHTSRRAPDDPGA